MDVAVVIPTYNRYEFTKRAIESVLAQSYEVAEIIVVDDGSTDETYRLKDEFNLKYIYQKNSGVSCARNVGIKNSTCRWIAFLDSDDEWVSDKLEKQVAFHKQNLDVKFSYTDEIWIRDNKQINIPKKFKKFGGDIFDKSLEYCNIAPSSVLVLKDVLDEVGLFDESLEVCEDFDLWLKILLKYEVGLVDEPLIKKYAGHNDQLSFKHWGMDRFRVKSLEKFLDSSKKDVVKCVILKKYETLLKGALKYGKMADVKIYTKKLESFI